MLYIQCLGNLSKNKQDGSSLQSQHPAQNLAAKHNRNFDKYSDCYYNNEKKSSQKFWHGIFTKGNLDKVMV